MAPNPLDIKTNALGRLIKEEKLYKEEAQEHKNKIQKMKASGEDEYAIKKMNEVLADTEQMIPELKRRIEQALSSLKQGIEGDRAGDGDVELAKERIAEAEAFLKR